MPTPGYKMSNEKNKVEALMFAVAKRIHLDEIARITGIQTPEKIIYALNELKAEYDAKGSSMIIHDEGEGYWKLTIKDHYMSMVQKVVSRTEMDKPLMETLAVIAWKYPVLQAEVIKIRHNKAYDHLKQLEQLGFITRARFGRTNKLTLTQKFFEYFDLPSKEQAKEVFKNAVPEKIKEQVEKTEQEIEEAERKLDEIKKREAKPKLDPGKSPMPVEEKELKEDLQELQKEEDKELKEMEKDIKDIEKEETKDAYAKVPEVQTQDEVSEPDSKPEGQD